MNSPGQANITRAEYRVKKGDRERLNGHLGAVLWFTGLSGSGKTTLANEIDSLLLARGCRTYVLDGDNIRLGLNRDLGFSPQDRTENIRRIGEVAHLFADAGVIAITAFISPYIEDRMRARLANPANPFVEIYCSCNLAVCEERDPKGLYRKARKGEIKDFTGVSAPYEAPLQAEVTLRTDRDDIKTCLGHICRYLEKRGITPAEAPGPRQGPAGRNNRA